MRLYLKYLAIHLRGAMQYKASFFMAAFGQFLTSFTAFLTVKYMLDRFNAVEGFTYSETLLCFAVVLMAFSLAECFGRGFDAFAQTIGNGQFDRILLRPRGVMFQVLASKAELTRVGRMAQAALMLAIAMPLSGVSWNLVNLMTVTLMIACGALVFFGLFVIYASICFFTLEGLEFMNIFTDGAREFGRYPFSIYGREVLRLLTYVIPLALFQYYPLLALTGRADIALYRALPIVSLVFLVPCFGLWRFGVSKYRSTGS